MSENFWLWLGVVGASLFLGFALGLRIGARIGYQLAYEEMIKVSQKIQAQFKKEKID